MWRTIQNDLTEVKRVCERHAADHNVSLEGEKHLGLKDYLHDSSEAL